MKYGDQVRINCQGAPEHGEEATVQYIWNSGRIDVCLNSNPRRWAWHWPQDLEAISPLILLARVAE